MFYGLWLKKSIRQTGGFSVFWEKLSVSATGLRVISANNLRRLLDK
jgi:hypothetical protein